MIEFRLIRINLSIRTTLYLVKADLMLVLKHFLYEFIYISDSTNCAPKSFSVLKCHYEQNQSNNVTSLKGS